MNRIKKIFQTRSKKVIPFLTSGYPRKEDTVSMVLAAESGGAAMVELGMPFSDPLADGPVIQSSSQMAIQNGVNIPWILETVLEIRKQSEIPITLMGYINPIIKYGINAFILDCKTSGIDGLIIPDLPPEEADEFVKKSKENSICPILLVAPNTPNNRIHEISKLAGDLIYCVSILGITGSQGATNDKLISYLNRVKKYSVCPYIVGFGIANRSDVISVNEISHGAVIGSAIIKEMKRISDPVVFIKNYIEKLNS